MEAWLFVGLYSKMKAHQSSSKFIQRTRSLTSPLTFKDKRPFVLPAPIVPTSPAWSFNPSSFLSRALSAVHLEALTGDALIPLIDALRANPPSAFFIWVREDAARIRVDVKLWILVSGDEPGGVRRGAPEGKGVMCGLGWEGESEDSREKVL